MTSFIVRRQRKLKTLFLRLAWCVFLAPLVIGIMIDEDYTAGGWEIQILE